VNDLSRMQNQALTFERLVLVF